MQTINGAHPSSTGPIQLTAEDLAYAARLNIRQAFFTRSFLFKVIVIVFVAAPLLCLLLFHILARAAEPGEIYLISALSSVGIILALCGLGYLCAGKQTRKIFKQHKTLHKPYTFEWNENGLELTSEVGNARLAWDDLLKMREDGKIMLFYENEQLYRLIPKRFLTEDQISSLRESWLARHG